MPLISVDFRTDSDIISERFLSRVMRVSGMLGTLLHRVLLGQEKNSQRTVEMVNIEKHHAVKHNSSEKVFSMK